MAVLTTLQHGRCSVRLSLLQLLIDLLNHIITPIIAINQRTDTAVHSVFSAVDERSCLLQLVTAIYGGGNACVTLMGANTIVSMENALSAAGLIAVKLSQREIDTLVSISFLYCPCLYHY